MASVTQIRKQHQTWKRVGAAAPAARRPSRRAVKDQLISLRRENNELGRAMYEAAQVQRILCGPRHLHLGAYEFAGEIFPVRHLSGDFISLMQLEGDLVFVIGDIAGKGLIAAMWFTHVVGMIRRQISALGDPAAALTAVDRDLPLIGLELPLTTLFLARLNLESGEITYCNAGHPAALLIRKDGAVQELGTGGPVLGAISRASFVNGIAKLQPGETLLAYSDGITECRNPFGAEFGTDGLLNAARTISGPDADGTLFSLLAEVEKFAGNQHREDDIALVVLRRLNQYQADGNLA